MQLKLRISERTEELRGGQPDPLRRSLTDLNNEAAKCIKEGGHVTALALYALLFEKVRWLGVRQRRSGSGYVGS